MKRTPGRLAPDKRASGFSLVELMVSMTIGLILIGGAISVLYSSKITYHENERVARLQESGRSAVELMLRDMRAGGFKGCNQTTPLTNALASPTGLLWNFGAPVQGFESTGPSTWSPAADAAIVSPRTGSDIVAVRTSRIDAPTFTTNASLATSTSDVTVDKVTTDSIPNGSAVMISDCSAAAVFSVDTFTDSGATATLAHSSTDLGTAFPTGALVVPVDTIIYYIRDSGTVRNGVRNPSLWRKVGANAAQELIEGIESMQALYGIDTDGDRLVNSYVKASAVTDWARVISVSIALLIRSIEPNALTSDTRSYPLLGTTVGPFNDRYERTLYTTTIALRNNTQ
jgi:type IV pilus assembly protein PilW